jgi:hypothetical protein
LSFLTYHFLISVTLPLLLQSTQRYIIPGLGDFGDRFFGTVAS